MKVTVLLFVVLDGIEIRFVSGGMISIVEVYSAGVGSIFPAGSFALTLKVYVSLGFKR